MPMVFSKLTTFLIIVEAFFQQHPTCFQPSPVAESHHVNNSNVTRHLVVYRTEVQSQSLAKLLNSKTNFQFRIDNETRTFNSKN